MSLVHKARPMAEGLKGFILLIIFIDNQKSVTDSDSHLTSKNNFSSQSATISKITAIYNHLYLPLFFLTVPKSHNLSIYPFPNVEQSLKDIMRKKNAKCLEFVKSELSIVYCRCLINKTVFYSIHPQIC